MIFFIKGPLDKDILGPDVLRYDEMFDACSDTSLLPEVPELGFHIIVTGSNVASIGSSIRSNSGHLGPTFRFLPESGKFSFS